MKKYFTTNLCARFEAAVFLVTLGDDPNCRNGVLSSESDVSSFSQVIVTSLPISLNNQRKTCASSKFPLLLTYGIIGQSKVYLTTRGLGLNHTKGSKGKMRGTGIQGHKGGTDRLREYHLLESVLHLLIQVSL